MRTAWAAAVLISLLFVTAGAAAQPSPSAELQTRDVHTNFMESFQAIVRNQGDEEMTVARIDVVVDWPGWAPTSYTIHEGREVISPGEARSFAGPATRMPQTETGEYHATLVVVVETSQGLREHQFETSVSISEWGFSPAGVPEFVVVPAVLTVLMLAITLLLFRPERVRGWPPLRAVPRYQRRRRT